MRRPPEIKPDNLVRYYPMGQSPATDLGPNGFDLTAVGTPSTIQGRIDEAVDFDGSTDAYKDALEAADKVQALTYAAWIYPDVLSGVQELINGNPEGAGGDGRGYRLSLNGSNVSASKGEGTGSFVSLVGAGTLSTGGWVHVASTFDNSVGMKVFVNGVEDGSNADTTNIEWTDSGVGPSPGQFYLSGARDNSAGTDPNLSFFNGRICETRAYDVALTAGEIRALMQTTRQQVMYA